jgi:hypothetical protein
MEKVRNQTTLSNLQIPPLNQIEYAKKKDFWGGVAYMKAVTPSSLIFF